MWYNQKGIENNNYKHGYRKTKLYTVWVGIKNRCLNLKTENYKYYGDRGITICDEWLEFIPFRDWSLENGYKEGLTIDRKENDGNYEPSNCQWLSKKENIRKQKQTILTMEKANEIRTLYNSGYYTQKQLAEKYKIKSPTICKIIHNKLWKN